MTEDEIINGWIDGFLDIVHDSLITSTSDLKSDHMDWSNLNRGFKEVMKQFAQEYMKYKCDDCERIDLESYEPERDESRE